MFPTWCRWPLLGLFLFFGVFAHGGFRCDKTDPGVTTDPGVNMDTEVQVLTAPAPGESSIPMSAIGILAVAGGVVTSLLARRQT